jgi:hypothetical protein
MMVCSVYSSDVEWMLLDIYLLTSNLKFVIQKNEKDYSPISGFCTTSCFYSKYSNDLS